MSKTNEILTERTSRYGCASDVADITLGLWDVASAHPRFAKLRTVQKQALFIIFNKIGRAINGDQEYVDNWVDISGYSQTVVDALNGSGITTGEAGSTIVTGGSECIREGSITGDPKGEFVQYKDLVGERIGKEALADLEKRLTREPIAVESTDEEKRARWKEAWEAISGR